MANIFISYSRQSEAIANTLAEDIEALGHTVWFDRELSGGQAWWDQILATVRDCNVFVVVLDPETLSSTACKREYGYAADLGKPILPVLVAEGVSSNLLPSALSQIQYVDYREQDRNAAFRLARALTNVPSPGPLPDPLPDPPEAPISYLGSLTEQVETTTTLSYEEQSVLVVDLKRSLRDPGTIDDSRTLLEKLRKRRDLFATIAEEIDELLGGIKNASKAPSRARETEPSPLERSKKEEVPSTTAGHKPAERQEPQRPAAQPTATITDQKPTTPERVKAARNLAIIGLAVAVLISVMRFGSLNYAIRLWPWYLAALVGGAIAGAISGRNRRGLLAALVGMGVGVFFGTFITWPGSELGVLMMLLTPPLGAKVGVNIKKRKVQTKR